MMDDKLFKMFMSRLDNIDTNLNSLGKKFDKVEETVIVLRENNTVTNSFSGKKVAAVSGGVSTFIVTAVLAFWELIVKTKT